MEILNEFSHPPNFSENEELHLSSNAVLVKSDSAYKSTSANSKKVSAEENNNNKNDNEEALKEKLKEDLKEDLKDHTPVKQRNINDNNNISDNNLDRTAENIPVEPKKKESFPKGGGATSPVKERGRKKEILQNLLSQEKSKIKDKKKENQFSVVKPKNLALPEKNVRRDKAGVIINKKNRRRVKISFIDEISDLPLTEVILIDSFKKYNVMQGMPKDDLYLGRSEARCNCCEIF